LTGVTGSFLMLYLAIDWLHLSVPQIQTYIFLTLTVAGHMTLFVARNKGFFLKKPFPAPVMIWSAVATKLLGTLMAAYGFGLITPISWKDIGIVWGYAIIGAFFTDWAKITVYRHFAMESKRHEGFLKRVQETITPHARHHHGTF